MDSSIPPLKTSRLIDDNVEIEGRSMKQLSEKYSHNVKGGPGFAVYLSNGLPTYSHETLKLYYDEVSETKK